MTTNDLLMLVGRLDDAAGFDTPRERFRRFLTERVTDPKDAAAILDDCQRGIGEQPHRVLQDCVVLLGRFLGFETTFGTYQRTAGTLKFDGQWRSRGRLHVVLEVRTDQIRPADFETLERSLAALVATHVDPEPCLGLCVVARQYAGRPRLEAIGAEGGRHADVRLVSVRSLAWLAEAVAAGQIKHDEVIKLLKQGVDLDFAVELLERMATQAPQEPKAADFLPDQPRTPTSTPPPQRPSAEEPTFWAATIAGSDRALPEQVLSSVIGQRRILGVASSNNEDGGTPGDWVCLFIPGRGIVGHAQLASIVERSSGVVRHSEQFSRVFRLENVDLYDTPRDGAERRLTPSNGNGTEASSSSLRRISRDEFLDWTTWQGASERRAEARSATNGADAVTDLASH